MRAPASAAPPGRNLRQDYLGNPVTAASDATLAAIDDFVGGFLGYEQRMLGVLAAADADPGNCLANAYAGWLWMFLESPEAPGRAAIYLARAERVQAGATRRERLAVDLLRDWVTGDVVGATRRAGARLAGGPPAPA